MRSIAFLMKSFRCLILADLAIPQPSSGKTDRLAAMSCQNFVLLLPARSNIFTIVRPWGNNVVPCEKVLRTFRPLFSTCNDFMTHGFWIFSCHRKKRCQNCKKVVDFVRFHLGATTYIHLERSRHPLRLTKCIYIYMYIYN